MSLEDGEVFFSWRALMFASLSANSADAKPNEKSVMIVTYDFILFFVVRCRCSVCPTKES